ncbi:MAG: FAD-dependent oxidoreductase [Candidatus Electrothrix sp. AR4]|nr:FAD-dependent oxidoreductase [Candidatus Electrothrix sp. AR4]
MTLINRDHTQAEKEPYDLLIIGGGVYGTALSLVASQMGLRNLLVEKRDFGWATSYNSLRTIHGGLRYLQKMDLTRFFESVGERHWFMQEFPGLVTPLPCLMPLYGNGPYRPSVFRVALGINDFLSRKRNQCVRFEQELKNGHIISPEEVIRLFPQVDTQGLQGGAIWYDGAMPSSQLVVMEMLKQACLGRTTALNYTEAESLVVKNNRVQGLRCVDQENGTQHTFRAKAVINAAGPWCRSLAALFDADDPGLFKYSIAWNLLMNKPALSNHSVAVKPKKADASMYFIHAWNGLIMGGTVHSSWNGVAENPMPDGEELDKYLADLNYAVPSLNAHRKDILQVYSGLLPVQEQGGNILADREVIKDHGKLNGPQGLYSVSGVKFTTARKVAEKTIKTIFPEKTPLAADSVRRQYAPTLEHLETKFAYDWQPENNDEGSSGWRETLSAIIREQSVQHLDDLLIRRTTIGDNPLRALEVAPVISEIFPWDEERRDRELARLRTYFLSRSPEQDHDNR